MYLFAWTTQLDVGNVYITFDHNGFDTSYKSSQLIKQFIKSMWSQDLHAWLPCRQKYKWELNLAIWPQITIAEILINL